MIEWIPSEGAGYSPGYLVADVNGSRSSLRKTGPQRWTLCQFAPGMRIPYVALIFRTRKAAKEYAESLTR